MAGVSALVLIHMHLASVSLFKMSARETSNLTEINYLSDGEHCAKCSLSPQMAPN